MTATNHQTIRTEAGKLMPAGLCWDGDCQAAADESNDVKVRFNPEGCRSFANQ